MSVTNLSDLLIKARVAQMGIDECTSMNALKLVDSDTRQLIQDIYDKTAELIARIERKMS